MATTFGRQGEDVVADRYGNVLDGVSIELYETKAEADTGANVVAVVTTNSLGRWEFVDPTNRSRLYGRDPNGNVWALEAEEDSTGQLSGLDALPSGATFAVTWNGSAWVYAGGVTTSRPSPRNDLTMIAIGGTTGPSFGVVGVDIWLREAA